MRTIRGNLNALGVSPAGFLFRAINSAGTPIFDSEGLIEVMSQPSGSPSVLSGGTVTGIPADGYLHATGNSMSFTLERMTSCLALCLFQIQLTSGSASNLSIAALKYDPPGSNVVQDGNANQILLDATSKGTNYPDKVCVDFADLAAGSHTVSLMVSPRDASTAAIDILAGGILFVFRMGR